MGDPLAVIGKRHALVTISNLPGNDRQPFATLTGGGKTVATTKVYNGGSPKANPIPGRPVIADLTITRPFEPGRDGPLLAALRKQVGKFVAKSISKQYLDLDGVAVGKPSTWTGCLLTGASDPDYDESSGDGAFITLTFSPADIA